MTICNIAGVQEWFEILQTTERTQTAIMILSPDGNSSEEMNTHHSSDQVLLLLEGTLEAEVGARREPCVKETPALFQRVLLIDLVIAARCAQ